MAGFGFESTADEVLEGKDLSGRTALVTGGYSGLGLETARAMAAKGAHIILSGRDATKLSAAADEIAEATGAKVDTLVCDRASLANIRKALAPGAQLLIAEPMAETRGAEGMGDAYFGLYLWSC